LSIGLLGRALSIAGIVTGLLAVGLPFADGSRYADDGTVLALLIVLLCCASWLPAEIGRDRLGAAVGASAFGYFLFLPATAAFDAFGALRSGAWVGLGTALIPIGAVVVWAGREPGHATAPRPDRSLGALGLPLASAGLALAVAGIWLDVASNGPTYWNASSSGHAVGILMLLLAALNAVLLAASSFASALNLDLLVAAITVGFVEAGLVSTAFGDFGALGAGGWLEACAGALLLAGVLGLGGAAAPPGSRS
jgi:hypothetical protein